MMTIKMAIYVKVEVVFVPSVVTEVFDDVIVKLFVAVFVTDGDGGKDRRLHRSGIENR